MFKVQRARITVLSLRFRRNELMKNAKFLSEDELQNEFDSIGEDYENIWKYTNQDVSDLEEELSALEAEHDAYDDLIIQLK